MWMSQIISRSGIGFNAKVPLDIHTYYDTKIQIWTKEVVDAVVEIVRRTDSEEEYITMVLCLSV